MGRLTYGEIAFLCLVTALPMLVALARRNWRALLPALVLGVLAMYMFLDSGELGPAIALWIVGLVYAFIKRRRTREIGEASPGSPA